MNKKNSELSESVRIFAHLISELKEIEETEQELANQKRKIIHKLTLLKGDLNVLSAFDENLEHMDK